MTQFENKTFSVPLGSKNYRDNWEKSFMIWPEDYIPYPNKSSADFYYVTEDLIRQYHGSDGWDDFREWMAGQTCSLHPETGELQYYAWDYQRWATAKARI